MLNIVYIASNIPTPKGVNNDVIIRIANKLNKIHNVVLFYPSPFVPVGFHLLKKHAANWFPKKWTAGEINVFPIKYIRLPFTGIQYKFYALTIRFISQNKIVKKVDLFHAHFLFQDGSMAYLFNRKYSIPYVITVRGNDIKYIQDINKKSFDFKLANKIVNRASMICVMNKQQQEIVNKYFGVLANVIPHGIDSDSRLTSLDKKNFMPNDITILSVANATKDKRVDWIINAIKEYKGEVKVNLRIIGDGDEYENWINLSKSDNRIDILGKKSNNEVFDELAKSQIFCLPSKNETFGLVFVEAASQGNALLGTRYDGIWEHFDEESEMLYSENEIEFQYNLYRLIEDSVLRKKLAIAAYNKSSDMTWSKVIKKYDLNYKEVVSGSSL